MIDAPAPILLFCYKRLDVLKCTVSALQKNCLAKDSELFIFSDGAKTSVDLQSVEQVRSYLKTISGFRSIAMFESSTNKGLARSVISGVSEIFKMYDRAIVLEDDLITSTNFLSYMNQALSFYSNKNVFSISGFSFPINGLPSNSVYFTTRASSWGWATWKDRWEQIDWEVKDYPYIKQNRLVRKEFNRMGTDLAAMLDKQMNGKMDSWAIRWCYHQFKSQMFTVFPAVSKVQNIGFGNDATHTHEIKSRYSTVFDQSGNSNFLFTEKISLDFTIIKQVTKHYSIRFRIYYKIINWISKGRLSKQLLGSGKIKSEKTGT